jgi:hypothetical protein
MIDGSVVYCNVVSRRRSGRFAPKSDLFDSIIFLLGKELGR